LHLGKAAPSIHSRGRSPRHRDAVPRIADEVALVDYTRGHK